jgi:predicted AlkP superfamily phosphohydrolase/phosphomutase
LPLTLTVSAGRDRLTIEAAGQKRELSPGQWSDWVSLKFRVNPLITVSGYGHFRLDKVSPEISLYLSPIQFDPERLPPGMALSYPSRFAPELVKEFGRYKTMGWAIDTWSIQSGTLSEKAFLEDVAATAKQDRQMLNSLLRQREKLLFHYFEFPDRVAHVFWRLRDPLHPAYDAALAKVYGNAVEESYETMDAIVGETAQTLGPRDVLIVLSDHGFASWRRSVNYNSWLVDHGYLVLKGGAQRKSLEALFSRGQFWEAVDWAKSRVYSMGFGDLYVNLKGREADGIVSPGGEYEALRTEISKQLLDLKDPKTGDLAVSRVFRREEIYRRFDPRLIPDLIVSNRPGYRVSWQSTLGVPTENLFEDNKDVWSGDHCSLDPDLVRGVLFSSKPFRADPVPHIADVTASIRELLGAPAVADAAGEPLW